MQSKSKFSGRKVVNVDARSSSAQCRYLRELAASVSTVSRHELYESVSGSSFFALPDAKRWNSLTRGQASDLIAQYKKASNTDA